MDSPKVVIYTRSEPHCVWCERAKVLLKGQKIPFEERDYREVYEKETWVQGAPFTVPQVYIDGMLIGGYEKLKEYLNV